MSGTAFAYIRKEDSRFSGTIKRIHLTPKRPSPQEIFDLQDYYDSKEPTSWEREIIEYTFKTMQLLGFEVKLYRTKGRGKNKKQEEVDLSKRFIKPAKEIKKEIKRAQKGKDGSEESKKEDSEEDEENLNEEGQGTAVGSIQGPRDRSHQNPHEDSKDDFSSIAIARGAASSI
jgi:hypothetical protein